MPFVLVALVLPIVCCVLIAVGALLHAMDDGAGAAVVNRLALASGVLWLVDLVVLLLLVAVRALYEPRELE